MKHILAVSLFLILMVGVGLVSGQEKTSLSQSYASAYFQLKFDYPADWEIIEQLAGPMLLNYDYRNSQPYDPGHARMQFWTTDFLDELLAQGIEVDTSGSVELLNSLRKVFDSDEKNQMGVASPMMIGGLPAARAEGTFLKNPTLFLAINVKDDEFIIAFGDVYGDALTDFKDLFLQIVATAQFNPTQFSDELPAINPNNAAQITRYKSLRTLNRRDGQTDQVSLSPDGMWAASALGSTGLKLWDVATAELVHHFRDVSAYQSVFLPNTEQLVAVYAFEENLQVINLKSQEVLKVASDAELSAVAVTPDGKTLVTGGWSGKTQVWDPTSFTVLQTLAEIADTRIDAVSASSTHIAATHTKGQVALYELNNLDSMQLLPIGEGSAKVLAFSADGSRLAIITTASDYLVFDVENTEQLLLGSSESNSRGGSAVLNQDGSLLAITATNDGLIWLIDVATGELLVKLSQGGDEVSALAFSADDTLLLAGGFYDETLILWAVP